jgi:biotin carboxyl carrier protein
VKAHFRAGAGPAIDLELRALPDGGWDLSWDGRSWPLRMLQRDGPRIVFELDGVVHRAHALVTPREIRVVHAGREVVLLRESARTAGESAARGAEPVLRASVPGRVLRLAVKSGDAVRAGDVLLVVEAMKMENPVYADADGIVEAVHVGEGEMVRHGQDLITCRYAAPSE